MLPTTPWKRHKKEIYGCFKVEVHSFSESFDSYIDENIYLDLDTKVAALKVSPSVVALVSHSGDNLLFVCSGTIVECQEQESRGPFISNILTSASLLRGRSHSVDPSLAPNIRVDVYLWDGKMCQGEISAWDIYFNLAIIKISTSEPLQTPTFKHLYDSMPLTVSRAMGSTSFEFKGHHEMLPDSNSFNIGEGDKVIALGRHYISHKIMAAPGTFRNCCCDLDCELLCTASCKITVPGIGGPLINRHGEVIGINFFDKSFTPFLPMNVVSKCLEILKKDGRACWPWLGIKASSLNAASADKVEQITQKFPQICKGVLVEEVTSRSPAAYAGIRPNDIIVQCGGKSIGSSLEFYEVMFYKIGEPVEVSVRRPSE